MYTIKLLFVIVISMYEKHRELMLTFYISTLIKRNLILRGEGNWGRLFNEYCNLSYILLRHVQIIKSGYLVEWSS